MDKSNRLFIILAGFFITNAIIAEFIGVKIFSMEATLGIERFSFTFFGIDKLSFDLTCGVLIWPVVFVMTDIINEYYGRKGVKMLSFLAAGLIGYAFLVVLMAMHSTPADWWVQSHIPPNFSEVERQAAMAEVGNYNSAFRLVFGQGQMIIIASLIAFLVGQFVDAFIFYKIKKASEKSQIWVRATVSTLVSQLIDSFIVLFVAFYLGGNWTMKQVMAVGTMNYIYKFSIALLLIPVLYMVHKLIESYLGKAKAELMRHSALNES